MSRYYDANGNSIEPEDVLDPEELAEYRRYERPVPDQHAALARRARIERAS